MDQEGQINQWLLDDSDEDLNISLDEDDSEDSDAEQPANSEHDSNSEVSGDDIDNVLEDIVRYTNDRLRKLRTNYTRESDVVDSNIDEIKALIGRSQIDGEHSAHPRPTALRDEARPTPKLQISDPHQLLQSLLVHGLKWCEGLAGEEGELKEEGLAAMSLTGSKSTTCLCQYLFANLWLKKGVGVGSGVVGVTHKRRKDNKRERRGNRVRETCGEQHLDFSRIYGARNLLTPMTSHVLLPDILCTYSVNGPLGLAPFSLINKCVIVSRCSEREITTYTTENGALLGGLAFSCIMGQLWLERHISIYFAGGQSVRRLTDTDDRPLWVIHSTDTWRASSVPRVPGLSSFLNLLLAASYHISHGYVWSCLAMFGTPGGRPVHTAPEPPLHKFINIMAGDERNFRSSYYEKVGFRSVEEKKSLEILLKDKPLDKIKLKQFSLRFTVPGIYRSFIWKILLGVDLVQFRTPSEIEDMLQALEI
uniref:Uncharacterized protein n=1 Tax=Timema genevievae TaxID=629358 RepID=A0A7R9JQP8_TIMGE|nr:unnamed protein product [Timema genevievae]